MDNYFENKLTYNQISFCYTNKAKIDEREIHSYNEILFYLGEEVSFLTESFSKQIEKHTLLIIPKEKYHYFDNIKGHAFERLKINFPDIPELESLLYEFSDIRIINAVDDSLLFALKKICSALENNGDKNRKFVAFGAFLILLSEINKINTANIVEGKNNSQIVSECIELISGNLEKSISIENISRKLSVSESALTHSFKKEMGISVHKYIQQKRMILAKKLIEAGNRPTKIYFDCGYKEYSAFYKAYCKMYGYPPSER